MEYLNRTSKQGMTPRPLKIIQFGGGNFLRAFVGPIVQKLNEETDFNAGIVIVKPTDRGDYKALKSQDGLFSVELEGIVQGKFIRRLSIIDCVQEIVNPYTDWDAYLELAKASDVRFIISNTTEAGIKFNPSDVLEQIPPKEFPAKLTLFLYERYQFFNGVLDKGCLVLPCELIEDNGVALRKTILQYADQWKLPSGFGHWVNNACFFFNTLVDCIVSGYPEGRIDVIEKELGYKDQLAVHGEIYLNWLIEGPEQLLGEFPFNRTDLNIDLVPNLAPYRNLKVRVLNGAHTSMVCVGYLLGHRLVKDVMQDNRTAIFVEDLLHEEVVPTLNFTADFTDSFITDVLDRFRNPALNHKLISIALNSTSKFVTRLLPTLMDVVELTGELPKRIVLTLAALVRIYRGVYLQGVNIPLQDTTVTLDFFSNVWEQFMEHQDYEKLTKQVFKEISIWGQDLNQIPKLSVLTSYYLEAICEDRLPFLLDELNKKEQPLKSDT